jgi:hypothetical protein
MELAKHVRRIDSFLNGHAEDRWGEVSRTMVAHTTKITPKGNQFSSCQTADRFCATCDTMAHKICSGALFTFDFRFKQLMREIERKEHDPAYETVSEEKFATQLAAYLEDKEHSFTKSIKVFVSNIKTAFYLYFYADAIRNAKTGTEEQLQYASTLCSTQSTISDFNGHTQLNQEALDHFPQFKAKCASLNPETDTTLFVFFATCVVLPWTAISNSESADRALCAIFQSVSTPGLPTQGPMEACPGPLGAMLYGYEGESSEEVARRRVKQGAFILGVLVFGLPAVAVNTVFGNLPYAMLERWLDSELYK